MVRSSYPSVISALGFSRNADRAYHRVLPQSGRELVWVAASLLQTPEELLRDLAPLRERGIGCPVIGISVNRTVPRCRESLDTWWAAIGKLLDLDPARPQGPIEIHDRFVGQGYGDATADCLDAILLMAETEGVLLDPVYSGKVFDGGCAQQREGRWQPDRPVVMLHSGGTPALFAYHEEIRAHLVKRGVDVPH